MLFIFYLLVVYYKFFMLVGLPFPDASVVKKWPYNAGDTGSIPWLGDP